ncbi:glycine cleavage system protein H [Frankia sp. CcI49]|uniref:glycine cleavage system protein GcvH n=1 Tax=unclassified Frankia TaxID=2632575 RepID=UPI0006C9FAFE|nr:MULTISPECIES: glycine cleavage system protein GcvH [unclassified Frankia]KPM52074.1 glycine cleavage system protein H [Frankia sp. R43]ONH58846.1 glycine cleavage system protein H [Frankia sp. CcI49]
MTIPSHLRYTEEHEWLEIDGDLARVGITAYAADALGDVVFVDLPEIGAALAAGEPCGEVESTKSVSDLCAPGDGEVIERNEAALGDPALLNSDPFGSGWLFRMRLTRLPDLLDADGYTVLTGAPPA